MLGLKFRHRISLLVALAALALLVVTAVTLVLGRRSEREMSGVETRYLPLIELDRDLKTAFAAIPRLLENGAAAAEEGLLKEADASTDQLADRLNAGAQTLADNGGDARALVGELRAYYATAREVTAQLIAGAPPDTLSAKVNAMRLAQVAFAGHLDTATTPDRRRVAAAFAAARESQRAALVIDIVSATTAVVLMVLLSWQIIRRTVRSLGALSHGMERLARGEFGQAIEVTSDDELGDLAREANRTAARLREYRQLGEREDWIKTGLGKLGDETAGDLEPVALGRKAMSFLAKYIGAEVAVAYVADEGGVFHLLDTYGTAGAPAVPASFKLGETILGQAAVDDAVRVLTALPPDYLAVRSALGGAPPRCVLVVPFTHERRAMGVMELGLLDVAEDRVVELVTRARSGLGIAFRMAESRQRAQLLLDETQRQAEEIRVAYDTVEARNQTLQTSEQQLQRQQEELRQSNHELAGQTATLEVQRSELARAGRYKSEFLANMSHELRTPLNSIMILSKILGDNEERNLTEKQTEFATMIHRSGDELLTLINDVLDMAKVEAGKQELFVERLRVADVFDYVRRMFAPQASQKGLAFEVVVAGDVPLDIRTDRTKLSQVIKNLISNALKFTAHGRVAVHVSRSALAGGRDAVAIAVSDTGIGIAADKQAVIFEAFAQADGGTSRKYGGTGLGLTIAKQLAVRLGGDLGVTSEIGKGSVFTFAIPVGGPEGDEVDSDRSRTGPTLVGPMVAPVLDDAAQLERGEPCLLVIEDDRNFATLLVGMVRAAGFKCLVASAGRTGLELARLHKPSGIILDVGLPDLDGWSVMEALKADRTTQAIPVHFITAADGAERAERMGAVGFTTKPVDPTQVRSALRALEEAARAGVRRLLLVESDPAARTAMRDLLVAAAFDVDAVATTGDALVRLTAATYGCVIANLALPDTTGGFELFAKIRAEPRTATIPIVVHTSTAPTAAELRHLEEDSHTIVVMDGERSHERVLEETRLFVHRVRIELPAQRRQMTELVHNQEAVLAGKTVLVVDDDMRNVYSLSSALRAKQLRVLTAADGQEALDELAQHPETGAVLMDVMMPRMDGHEATRRIRAQARFAALPVIALTAKTMPGEREKCLEAGASDYIPKPVDVDRLLALLRVWLS